MSKSLKRVTLICLAIAWSTPAMCQDLPALPNINQIRTDPKLDMSWVPPLELQQALAAAEDPAWFTSFPAISPISRQVAKTYIPDGIQTILRRMMEVRLAVDLANEFTTEEIMSIYAQTIWLGARCYGMQNALQYRMARPLEDATLSDVLTLAALIRAPTIYESDQTRFVERFEYVVREGQSAGFWSLREAAQLIEAGPTPLIEGENCPN